MDTKESRPKAADKDSHPHFTLRLVVDNGPGGRALVAWFVRQVERGALTLDDATGAILAAVRRLSTDDPLAARMQRLRLIEDCRAFDRYRSRWPRGAA